MWEPKTKLSASTLQDNEKEILTEAPGNADWEKTFLCAIEYASRLTHPLLLHGNKEDKSQEIELIYNGKKYTVKASHKQSGADEPDIEAFTTSVASMIYAAEKDINQRTTDLLGTITLNAKIVKTDEVVDKPAENDIKRNSLTNT